MLYPVELGLRGGQPQFGRPIGRRIEVAHGSPALAGGPIIMPENGRGRKAVYAAEQVCHAWGFAWAWRR